MMKKITLLLMLLIASHGFSQQQTYLLDFEDGNAGSDASLWTSFNSNPASEVVTNPQPNGVNTDATSKVLKIVTPPNAAPGGECAAGVETNSATVGTWELDSGVPSNTSLSMMVHKSTVGNIGLQMINPGGAVVNIIDGATQPVTVANEWQLITFNFSVDATNIDKLVIFTDWTCNVGATRATESILHIDNITWGANKLLDPVIPDPPVTSYVEDFESGSTGFSGDVVSSFSDSFSNPEQTGINSSSTCAQIDGINVGDFSNAQVTLSGNLDFSAGDKGFRLMVQGPRAIPVKLKVEGAGAQERDANYTDVGNWQELYFDFTSETSTGWNKIVLFFEISTAPSVDGADDIFLFDNLEFGVFASLSTKDIKNVEFKTFPNPTQDSWTVKTQNTSIESIRVFDVMGKNVLSVSPNKSEAIIDGSRLISGLYFAQIKTALGTKSIKLIKQ